MVAATDCCSRLSLHLIDTNKRSAEVIFFVSMSMMVMPIILASPEAQLPDYFPQAVSA
jgi:hypothetical protein